ncbi:hypothetical protein [Vannielia sp. SX4]|uniref:hypothetical protein n=1 Tax=Vannielia sp. SX4 TaxID=3463852 RepID=UPI0040582F88
MRIFALSQIVALMVASWLPLPVAAEGLGRITAYIAGEAEEWHTITMEQGGRKVATASFEQGARLTELRVQGHPEPRFTSRDVFSVDVRFEGPFAPGAEPLSVDVMHVPEGMGGPFWTSRGAAKPARIDIVELEVYGSYGRLVATFEAELCFRPIISSATDTGNCRPVTGVIETEIAVD